MLKSKNLSVALNSLLLYIPSIQSSKCNMANCEHCWSKAKDHCIHVKTGNFDEYGVKGGICTETCSSKSEAK